MLTVIYGGVGSGKTLLLTILGYYLKSNIISNYQLFFQKPDYKIEEFNVSKFVQAKYENCKILMDEAYVYLESRLSMSNKNKAFSYILFQSRKKSIDMYLTVQLVSTIEKRYREMFDYSIFSHGFNGFEYIYSVYNHTNKETKILKLREDKIIGFYQLYDTNEVVKPDNSIIYQFITKTEKEERLDILTEEYLKRNDGYRITKDSVKLFLFKESMPTNYLGLLYATLKKIEEKRKKDNEEK